MKIGKLNNSQDGIVFDGLGEVQTLSAGHGNVPKILIDENTIRQESDSHGKRGGRSSTSKKHCWDLIMTEDIIVHNLQPRTGDPKKGGTGHLSKENESYCLDTLNSQAVEYKENYIQWDASGKGYNSQQDRAHYETGSMGYIPSTRTENKINVLQSTGRIRRLTEIECERLQGFPDVEKSCIFTVCKQPYINTNGTYEQSTEDRISVSAEEQNGKSILNVGNVENDELKENVLSAKKNLNLKNQPTSKPVQEYVHIVCEEQKVEIRNYKKELLLIVNTAEKKNHSPYQTSIEDFALHLVRMLSILEQIILNGAEGLHQKEQLLALQKNGEMHVNLYGREITQPANYAMSDLTTPDRHTKSITLNHSDTLDLEQRLAILFSYVASAMFSFIPKEILNADLLTIKFSVKHGWTKYGIYERQVWINKKLKTFRIVEGVEEISKTQRYKLIGNAVTRKLAKVIGLKLKLTHPQTP